MPKLFAFILLLLMSLAFAGEVVTMHWKAIEISYAVEEESKNEGAEEKANEAKLKPYPYSPVLAALPEVKIAGAAYCLSPLAAGYLNSPFNPPDVI